MSSVGQAVGGVVGAVVGFYVGGPSGALYGAQIGMGVGGAIDPPKGPTIRGPRLDDLSVQTSTYGAFIPRDYGTVAQTGNVFWLKGNRLTEVLNTSTSGSKGGGPQSTTQTFSYFATFAVGLCQGPIAGVRRIWIGSDLYYDAGSQNLADIIASNQNASTFTLYLGTDTQTADPLIQADRGAANVPAYRGMAYIVFDNLPLEKYSNSLVAAQVKVEVVQNGSTTGFTKLLEKTVVNDIYGPLSVMARAFYFNQPLLYYSMPVNDSRVGGGLVDIHAYDVTLDSDIVLQRINIDPAVWGIGAGKSDSYRFGSKSFEPGIITPDGYVDDTSVSSFGDHYSIRGWNYYTIRSDGRMLGYALYPEFALKITYTSPVSINTSSASYMWAAETTQDYVYFGVHVGTTPYLLRFFRDTGGFVDQIAVPTTIGGVSIVADDEIYYPIGSSIYLTTDLFASSTLLGSNLSSASAGRGGYQWCAYPIAEGVLLVTNDTSGGSLVIAVFQYSPTISTSYATLGDIVQAECLCSNLLGASDLDVTSLTDTVRGYRVSQLGAIRAGLDPLRAAWPFDVRQHGYTIQFVRRGGSSVMTIPAADLDARAAGTAPGVSIADVREMDLVLPRTVSLKYLDAAREYDINEQREARANTDAVSHTAIELPVVMTAAEAKQATVALLYLYWMERYDISFVLPPSYQALEPGDVIEIDSTNATYNLRLTTVTWLPDGRVECRAKYNSAALYTQVAVADEGQSTGATLGLSGPCVYELLDIPLLRDDDDTAGFPMAMTGYLSGWPGGALYRSDDGGQTWSDLTGVTAPGAVIGYATGTLAAHGGTVIDFASSLAVKLYSGSLASVTQAQMFTGQNWFAYGAHGRWEIIAAQNCVLQGDGSYLLSNLLRGQKGTEWTTGLHVASDHLVLLDAAVIEFISVNASTIGATRGYRAITTGRAIDSDETRNFVYSGVNLMCLKPVHLSGNRHPTTRDWTLTWVRRGRLDSWRDYVDLPLGETSEAYEVEIYTSGTYATLKRTLTGLTSATATYTSAQQVADFGSNQATLYLKIYQLSATVGRGYALTQSITR